MDSAASSKKKPTAYLQKRRTPTPNRLKVIYIAGPYRDPRGEYYVRENIRAAETAAIFVWASGGVALCPHKNTAHFGGLPDTTDETWIRGGVELALRSDAVWAIRGWDKSVGAIVEVKMAKEANIPVLTNIVEVLNFIRQDQQKTQGG